MEDENVIPLNDELLTVAKILDIESIASNYNLYSIGRVIDSAYTDNLLKDDNNKLLSNIYSTIVFFSDTDLVTPEFKEAGVRVLAILDGYKDGLVLTYTDISTLKTTLSVIYTELVAYGKSVIGLHKSITFSLVDGELEKALTNINTYPYAGIAKLNSLIFKNVNSLIQIDKVMDSQMKRINTRLAQLDVMIDMSKVSNSYGRGDLVSYAREIRSDIRDIVNNIFDSKYIDVDRGNDRFSKDDDIKITDIDSKILSAINTSRESIKASYGTFRVGLLESSFNLIMSEVDTDNLNSTLLVDAEFKEILFTLKANIDILTEIVCSITDAINGSIEKLKKSIPVSDNEIDNIDAI